MVETKTPFGLRQRYETELRGVLQAELGLSNTMQVPKLVKVVVNMGCLLYTSPSPRDGLLSRMPSSA